MFNQGLMLDRRVFFR